MLVGVIVRSMIYKAITPLPFKMLNSLEGPKVTAPQIEMRDGRYLAYKEWSVKRKRASHYIVYIHGYMGSRFQSIPIPIVMNELGLYGVTFDRARYGQSDPNPNRSVQSNIEDVVNLADGLGLRPKFHVIASSYRGYIGWGLLKYRPKTLAGVVFLAQGVNFWWSRFPKSQMDKAWASQQTGDKLSLMVAHYLPSFTYWYNNQKRFPVMANESENATTTFHPKDQELIRTVLSPIALLEHYKEAMQQGHFELKYRELMIMFSDWRFTPLTLENPFDTPVHIWQGTKDSMSPTTLQKYLANSLPWVQYHELPGGGHILIAYPGMDEKMVRTLLEDSNKKAFTL